MSDLNAPGHEDGIQGDTPQHPADGDEREADTADGDDRAQRTTAVGKTPPPPD